LSLVIGKLVIGYCLPACRQAGLLGFGVWLFPLSGFSYKNIGKQWQKQRKKAGKHSPQAII
jgi:hypothetical protein